MSKILANQFANFAQDGPVEALEGIRISPLKELILDNQASIQVEGSQGTAGQYLTSLGNGNGLRWTSPVDLDTKYALSAIDSSLPDRKIVRLTSSNTTPITTSDITLIGANGIALVRSDNDITFTLYPPTFPSSISAPNTDATFRDITVRNVTTTGGSLTVNGSVSITNNAEIDGNLVIDGNLTVNGDTTQLNVSTLNVEDNEIILNSNIDINTAPTLNGRFTVNRGSQPDVLIRWNESTDRWQITNNGTNYYNIPVDGEYAISDTNTITSIGTSGNQTTGTVTLQGSGATTVTQTGQVITIASTDTNTDTITTVGISGQEKTGTVTFQGSGATTVTQNGSIVTISSTDTNTDTNTTYDLTTIDGSDATRKVIRLIAGGSGSGNDDVILKAGSNISLVRTNNEIEIVGAPPGSVITYSISSETGNPSGAALRLSGSDTTTDDVRFVGSGATSVTRTDANTITINSTDTNTDTVTRVKGGASGTLVSGDISLVASGATSISQSGNTITISSTDTNTDTNTTYSFNAATTTGGALLRLADSIGGTADVKLKAGSNVSITRNSSTEIEIGLGLPQNLGTTDSPTFDAVYFGNAFANVAAFPNATTYDGMFVKATDTGAAYFSHSNNWVRIIDGASTGTQTIAGNLNVSGNLTVSGDTVTLNVSTLNVEDNEIVLNSSVVSPTTPSLNGLLTVQRGASNNVAIRWNESTDRWQFTNDGVNYTNLLVSGEYATTDTNTVTRLRATSTGTYLTGDITFSASGSASVTQTGNEIFFSASDTNTITSIGTSGNQVTGTVTLVGGGATVVSQSGNTITVTSTDTNTDTVTRLRGSTSGIYTSGDITITGQGSAVVTQSGSTITVSASDNNTVTAIGTSGNAVTGTVVLAASGSATVTQIGQTITIGATDTNTTYTAGTGVTISGASNAIAIGQAVGTTSNVTFGSVVSTNASTIHGMSVTKGLGADNNSTGLGFQVLNSTTSGSRNTAVGYQSQLSLQTGSDNTSVGYFSGRVIAGSGNTTLGAAAGSGITSGSYNVVIGNAVQVLSNTSNTQLAIGSNGATWLRGDANRHVNSIAFDGLREYVADTNIAAGNVVSLKQSGNISALSIGTDLATLPTPTASSVLLDTEYSPKFGGASSASVVFGSDYVVADHYNSVFGGIVSWIYDATNQTSRVALTATVSNYDVQWKTTGVLSDAIPFTNTRTITNGTASLAYLGTVSGKERYAVAVSDIGTPNVIDVAIIDLDSSFGLTLVSEFVNIRTFTESVAAVTPNIFVENSNNFFVLFLDSASSWIVHFDNETGTWRKNAARQHGSSGTQVSGSRNAHAARVGTNQWVVLGKNGSGNFEFVKYTLSPGNQPTVDFNGTAPSLTGQATSAIENAILRYDASQSSLFVVTHTTSKNVATIVFNINAGAFTFGSWQTVAPASNAYSATDNSYWVHYNSDASFWTLITGSGSTAPYAGAYRKLTVAGGTTRTVTLSDNIQASSNLANLALDPLTTVDDQELLGQSAISFIPLGSDIWTNRVFGSDGSNPGLFYYSRKAYTTTYSPDPATSQIIGVSRETVTTGNSAEVQYSGTYSGLTVAAARDYYPDYVNSGLTIDASTPVDYPATFKPIGKSLSGTELHIYDGQAGAAGSGTVVVAAASGGGGGGATYTVSAETITGGAELRLTGSDATTDGVQFLGNNGITVTRTNASIITIDGANFLGSLSDDINPTLGGDLSTNGNDIVIQNGDKIILGTSQNGAISYDVANTRNYFNSTNSDLFFHAKNYTFATGPSGFTVETALTITQNGSVALYFDDTKRFETTSTGAAVTGAFSCTSLTINGAAYVPGNTLINDNTFATATTTNVPSASSVKAYVDARDARTLAVTTITGGAMVNLYDASGTVQDTFDIIGDGAATVTRFDADTIQVSATNTTYSQSSVASGSNVNLRLTGSDSTNDDILITAGTGITFSSVTAAGFTISASSTGGLADIVNDTTPQLGGNLDLNTNSILGSTVSTVRGTGQRLQFGSGTAGEVGSMYFFKPGTGPVQLEVLVGSGTDFAVVTENVDGGSTYNRQMIIVDNQGSTGTSNNVQLLHGTSYASTTVRYQTTATGSTANGRLKVNQGTATLGVYDNGFEIGSPYNANKEGGMLVYDGFVKLIAGSNGGVGRGPYLCGQSIKITNENASETYATFEENGAVDLYYDNASRLTTTTTGVTVNGVVTATSFSGSGANLTGFTPLRARDGSTGVVTTSSLSPNASANVTIPGYKSYLLMKIQTSAAAWVTLYTDTGSRTTDSSRQETVDPTPGSGVIAEVITTGAATQIITPGVMGWNNDSTPSGNIYAKVVNKSGVSQAITVTLTLLQLEI